MNSVIFNPLEEFEGKYKNLHFEKTDAFFNELVKHSGVNIEENRATVKEYNEYRENLKKLKKKLTLFKVLRVLMCITVILIPLVILKTTPKIKALKSEIELADNKAEELLSLANRQMAPLNALFTDRDATALIEATIPNLDFESCFSAKQEEDMKINYDFYEFGGEEASTVDVLAGHYNENPFLFENKLVHTMGTETYHGYKTITWTETYRDSNGRLQTRRRSQTLHATVVKPKPFYSTQVVLNYCAQGGPELCFTRDATHLERKSEKEIERYVKKGEKRLKRKTDKAIGNNSDFTSMSNTDFEVLFDALDRTNEVQFRTLFTPLAQTNMVDLILSKTSFGDDFNFIKMKRTNQIVTNHSQGRPLILTAGNYYSYSFDVISANFIGKNVGFFKDVYFDFAPVWAIPIYQERPVHSLKPIPDYARIYSAKECEALANAAPMEYLVHPDTKTNAILKARYVDTRERVEETVITAYSYDIEGRVDYVSVYGGDGRFHSVAVPWDEYIPLEAQNSFYIAEEGIVKNKNAIAVRNGLNIYSAN
ncbi:MAG: hypothetical protein IJ946_02250 [Clostridia bacterium]|nr:hypothetical protein [Clostridia bacterium]